MDEIRRCRHCQRELPLRSFKPDRRYLSGYAADCFACADALRAARRTKRQTDRRTTAPPRAHLSWHFRNKHLSRFGLTTDDYERMASTGCAICRSPETGWRGLFHLDHDHRTGKFRGLLCQRCNLMLGHCRDDPAILAAAIAYLMTHNES